MATNFKSQFKIYAKARVCFEAYNRLCCGMPSFEGEIVLERYSEVLGLPVLCLESGKKIGSVKDLIFNPKLRRVTAVLVDLKQHGIGKKAIQYNDILSFGKDAVVVADTSCIKSYKKLEDFDECKERKKVAGLKIYSRSGNDYGIVKDVLFDAKTGLIECVEVSDGIINDIYKGRNRIPLFGKVEFSEESIIVDKEAIEEMTNTGGGFINKFSKNK